MVVFVVGVLLRIGAILLVVVILICGAIVLLAMNVVALVVATVDTCVARVGAGVCVNIVASVEGRAVLGHCWNGRGGRLGLLDGAQGGRGSGKLGADELDATVVHYGLLRCDRLLLAELFDCLRNRLRHGHRLVHELP